MNRRKLPMADGAWRAFVKRLSPPPTVQTEIRNSKSDVGGSPLLLAQLCWFIRLRWIAGEAVILGSIADWWWLKFYAQVERLFAVGLAILVCNAALWLLMRRLSAAPRRRSLLRMAWAQILLDLGCLTLLTIHSGGVFSPLLGFFVFHMVFASLLLPRPTAYGVATAAMVMVSAALGLTGQWPGDSRARLMLLGWGATLLLTVYLANAITQSLRRQRRRLVRQNRHIRAISRRLARQQQAMLQQEKMVALGQMASGVAHEIANPLASMDSLLQLLQRHPERLGRDPKDRSSHSGTPPNALTMLRQQVERISQIIRQMTAFAHPADTEWQVVPLNDLLEQSLEMVRFDRRLDRVRIDRQLCPTACPVRVQPHAIQQVLVNLVLNALDAMAGTAQPRLALRTRCVNDWCMMEVSDNGHGVAPEYKARLFTPFFTTKPPGKGTGLGLSISYSLVRRQGGSIEARSEAGQGATFIIRLPQLGGGPRMASPAGMVPS